MKNETANIVSLVSYKFLPPQMGGQKCIAFFNRYLSKNINLSCITTKENEIKYEQEYAVHNILSNSKLRYINLFYFFTLKRFIRQHKITHLIIEHPYYGWLAILLKWACKIKLVIHSHNIESMRFRSIGKWWWGLLWHYEKLVHRQADINFFIQDNDKEYAITHYKLNPQRCTIITYGFEFTEAPPAAEKVAARELICKVHGIPGSEKILLFNGTLNYKPNLDAVDMILEKINPLLLAEPGFQYKIIICGNKLPPEYGGLINYIDKNIIYAGFVDDINLYFKGADIFINPVTDGGGIKTKVVEALGCNLSVVSSRSGAIGIPPGITGEKLMITEDDNWENFARNILSVKTGAQIPGDFFKYFYWGFVAVKAATAMR